DRFWNIETCRVSSEFVRADAGAQQRKRQVADHLRCRRHLDDTAQEPSGRSVIGLDLLEPVTESQRDCLLAKVGKLATRDFMAVHPAGWGGQSGFERRVDLSPCLPVGLELAYRRQRQPGVDS